MDDLVLIKKEHFPGPITRKLQFKWAGPYKIIEVLREGGGYIVKCPFTHKEIQRTAGKLKKFHGETELLLCPIEVEDVDTENVDTVNVDNLTPPARERREIRPPRRLIEEY